MLVLSNEIMQLFEPLAYFCDSLMCQNATDF